MKCKASHLSISKTFLAKTNVGRTISKYRKNQIVFSQGDPANSVFYIRDGKVKVTVISEQGKEAIVVVLGPDEFCGEGCLTGQLRRAATAAAMTECEIMRLRRTPLSTSSTKSQHFPRCSSPICWLGPSA